MMKNEIIPMNFARILLICTAATFMLLTPGNAETISDIRKELSDTKKYFIKLEKLQHLAPYYSHRHYYNAKVYFDTAKYQVEEERNATLGSFYSVLAHVELKTMHTIALTRYYHNKKILSEHSIYKGIAHKGSYRNRRKAALAGSPLRRRERHLLCEIPYMVLFKGNSGDISNVGTAILDSIGTVLSLHGSGKMKITACISGKDAVGQSKEKNKTILRYFQREKRISRRRLKFEVSIKNEMIILRNENVNLPGIKIDITGIR